MTRRIYLAAVGGIFAASGLFAYFDPLAMAEFLGITAVDPSGETEIRATYGGLVLGIGLLMLCESDGGSWPWRAWPAWCSAWAVWC